MKRSENVVRWNGVPFNFQRNYHFHNSIITMGKYCIGFPRFSLPQIKLTVHMIAHSTFSKWKRPLLSIGSNFSYQSDRTNDISVLKFDRSNAHIN